MVQRRDGKSSWFGIVRALLLILVVASTSKSNDVMLVSALKPIRNLQVTFRGQSYTIRDGVSTVGELTEKFEELAGLTSKELNAKVVWKGRLLTEKDEKLSAAGVRNGDMVLILPGDSHVKGLDLLAVAMFMLCNDKTLEKTIHKLKEDQSEGLEALQEQWNSMGDSVQNLKRKDVADALRNGFDLAYHRLRASWEHPSLRQGMHDPERIESYRKIVSTSLTKSVLEKSPSRLQEAIKSPEVWRKEFQKVTSTVIRLGDTIMDGILDVLLDVLKQSNSASRHASQTLGSIDTPPERSSDPRMDDPSLANDLLYELSESEDDVDM